MNPETSWVDEHDEDLLVEKAGTWFAHAVASVRFLEASADLHEQLAILLSTLTGSSTNDFFAMDHPFADVHKLYDEILNDLIPIAQGPEYLRIIFSTIILLDQPLPIGAIERLSGLKQGAARVVLEQIPFISLSPTDCPQICRPPFLEYLQDETRCIDRRYFIDIHTHEAWISLRCLHLLSVGLCEGMMAELDASLINTAGTQESRAFPLELQYSCRYWVAHVSKSEEGDPAVVEAVEEFVAKTMLSWMEAMSWLGEASLCLTSLQVINSWMVSPYNLMLAWS